MIDPTFALLSSWGLDPRSVCYGVAFVIFGFVLGCILLVYHVFLPVTLIQVSSVLFNVLVRLFKNVFSFFKKEAAV